AAGVGPYGAVLADGGEYTGNYDLDEDELYRWHRERWQVLTGSGADLVACETLPSLAEARALARLLTETPGVRAWMSFSCRDGEHIGDGTPMQEVVAELAPLHARGSLVAVGVNCTAPRHVPALVRTVAAAGIPASPTPTPGRSGIRCTDAGAVPVNRASSVPPPWIGGGPGRPWWAAAVAPAPNTSVRSVPTWAASGEGPPPAADLRQGLG